MEEQRERLSSQWEMTNARRPERSACVNPPPGPGPYPTSAPLRQPHSSVSFSWMGGSVTEKQHVHARVCTSALR